ncbi:class I SAM-dependent methyltransferase [Rhodoferax sp.]|uniref:class I SAM-dependent methyltransferase n=1 Tax=Rhodoferax sp. TaxID=50421 RepID=UPI00261C4D58|nr:class I SAM-dependent methyltransferase [Rhodoferax sp.]MDD2918622.1 class I SAM-dependent methyltransferase [Rhodoferax sp.]
MQTYSDKSGDYFAHARKEITPLLPKNCGRVLEIGCGSGATLGWLRRDHQALHTMGIEIADAAAGQARLLADEVFCLDFERHDLPGVAQKFDLILCLDVLEHMVDPWRVVDRLATHYLETGGTLIVSLPNVRHYSVVLPLLFGGRWDYEDAGLLDRTHLRFFTKTSARALLSHPLLGSVTCTATGFDGWSAKGALNLMTLGLFQELVSYQYFLSTCKVR